jgi:N-acetylneuraminic acid mutarotase
MGVAKIIEGKYFLCGGIDSLNEKPSKAAYVYYPGTNKALEVAKLASKKYNFAICANSKFVYIFGGKNENEEILNECEKYSFEEEKWIKMPNLPCERMGAKALMIGTKVLLFGGHDTLQNISSIDMYSQFYADSTHNPIPSGILSRPSPCQPRSNQ